MHVLSQPSGAAERHRFNATHARSPGARAISYQTPFEGTGNSRLTLLAGLVRGDTPAGMTSRLADALRAVPVGPMRERNVLSAAVARTSIGNLHRAGGGTKRLKARNPQPRIRLRAANRAQHAASLSRSTR